MSDAPEQPVTPWGAREPVARAEGVHDDDELAAALQAQLDRITGPIPVITPELIKARAERAASLGLTGRIPARPISGDREPSPIRPPEGRRRATESPAAEPRFLSAVPHFAPPAPATPPAPADAELATGVAAVDPAHVESERDASAGPSALIAEPSAGTQEQAPRDRPPAAAPFDPSADTITQLEQVQARLQDVTLDPGAYAEWEQSLRAIGEERPAESAPSPEPTWFDARVPEPGAPDADTGPRSAVPLASALPQLDWPGAYENLLPAPSEPASRPDVEVGELRAVSAAGNAGDVLDAEIVDDEEQAESAATGEGDTSSGVLGYSGPMPATGAMSLVPRTLGEPTVQGVEDEEFPAPADLLPFDPLEVHPIALDEGFLTTGSIPIITTALDSDLDDDADDVAAPQESLFASYGSQVPVGPPLPGTSTGPVAPVTASVARALTGPIPIVDPVASPDPFVPEIEDLAATPEDQRLRGPVSQFWLWLAPNSSLLTLALGAGILGLGISLRQALLATVLGLLVACIPLGMNVLASKRSGQPVAVTSRASFGIVGNIVPTLLLFAVRLFWAATLVWLLARAFESLLTTTGWSDALPASVGGLVSAGVVVVVAALVAVYGNALLARVTMILGVLSIALAVLVVVVTAPFVDLSTALAVPDGNALTAIGAGVLVFSLLTISWVAVGGELARYQQPGSSGVATTVWASFGAALPAFLLIGWGVLLSASSGALAEGLGTDPIAALAARLPDWYPVPLLLAVSVGLLSSLATVLYSTGLTLGAAGVPLPRQLRTIIVAVLSGIAGIGLLLVQSSVTSLIGSLVPVLAVPIAAWVGIMTTELLPRGRSLDAESLLRRGGRYRDWVWPNVVALIVISVVGIGLVARGTLAAPAGYLWALFGLAPDAPIVLAQLGVPLALILGLLTPLGLRSSALRR